MYSASKYNLMNSIASNQHNNFITSASNVSEIFWGPIEIESTNLVKSILIYDKRNLCLFTLHNQLWNVGQCHVWIESCLERVCKTSSRIHIFDSIHVTLQSLKSGFSRILWIQLLQLLVRRRHTEKEMVFIVIVVR